MVSCTILSEMTSASVPSAYFFHCQVCLNDPSYKNAMSGKMMRDLSDAVDELAAWADTDRGKGFVLRAADNNADPAKVVYCERFRL